MQRWKGKSHVAAARLGGGAHEQHIAKWTPGSKENAVKHNAFDAMWSWNYIFFVWWFFVGNIPDCKNSPTLFCFAFRCGRPAKQLCSPIWWLGPIFRKPAKPKRNYHFWAKCFKNTILFDTFWTSLNAKTACPQPACAAQPLQNQENSMNLNSFNSKTKKTQCFFNILRCLKWANGRQHRSWLASLKALMMAGRPWWPQTLNFWLHFAADV